MRHFELFELENLLNSTGSIFFRWRCQHHLKSCEICQKRMEQLLAERNFAARFRTGILNARYFDPESAKGSSSR